MKAITLLLAALLLTGPAHALEPEEMKTIAAKPHSRKVPPREGAFFVAPSGSSG